LPEPHHEADVIAHFVDFVRETSALNAKARSSVITEEEFATRWFTGLESEKATLLATTQEGMRFMDGDLERRLKTTQKHLRFPTLNIQTYTDTMFSSLKSIRGYTCSLMSRTVESSLGHILWLRRLMLIMP
jgi:hypothetical protein